MFGKHKSIALMLIIGIVLLSSVAGIVVARADTSTNNLIYAAYQKDSGQMRYINSPSDAKNTELVISWNQAGPAGPAGAAGAAGPVGPQGPAGPGGSGVSVPTLITVADNQTVPPGIVSFPSTAIDISQYRNFKLFARMTPAPATIPMPPDPTFPMVNVNVREYVTGQPGEGSYSSVASISGPMWLWNNATSGTTPAPARWTSSFQFGALTPKIKVSVNNMGTDPVTISLYLLATSN